MRIAGMTPEEWAKDTITAIQIGNLDPQATLTALVEKIHCETAMEYARKYGRSKSLEVIQEAVDTARTERKGRVN